MRRQVGSVAPRWPATAHGHGWTAFDAALVGSRFQGARLKLLPVSTFLAAAVVLGAPLGVRGEVRERPDLDHVESRFARIEGPYGGTTVLARPRVWEQVPSDIRPRLELNVRNNGPGLWWVRVRLQGPAPNIPCDDDLGLLLPGEVAVLSCLQDTVLAGTDYLVDILRYGPGPTDTLETIATRFRLSPSQVKKLNKAVASRRRELAEDPWPKRYPNIFVQQKRGSEKLSKGVKGTLVVKPSGLEHVSDDGRIDVGIDQLRRVSVSSVDVAVRSGDSWINTRQDREVMVDWQDADTAMVLTLKTGVFDARPVLRRIETAIQALIDAVAFGESGLDSASTSGLDTTAAGWPGDPHINVAICATGGNQTTPGMVGDGAGGVLLVWVDDRRKTGGIYAQHLLADGAVDPSWPAGGLAVCPSDSTQIVPQLASDGRGGAIITWLDRRTGRPVVRAQHVLENGRLDSVWPAEGLIVSSAAGDAHRPAVVEDGSGGAIVMWTAVRSNEAPSLHVQHVLENGRLDLAWPAPGRAVSTLRDKSAETLVISDGRRGAIVAWEDQRSIYAQRVPAGGDVDPAWPASGLLVSEGGKNTSLDMDADGANGAIIAWKHEARPQLPGATPGPRLVSGRISEIRVQHVLPGGAVDASWPESGRVLVVSEYLYSPKVVRDGAGGAIVVWDQESDLHAQHVLADGSLDPEWIESGRRLCIVKGSQNSHAVVSDGAHGAIVAWEDNRSGRGTIVFGNGDIYAQRVLRRGALDAAWPAAGRAVCIARDNQYHPSIISDGAGGAIVAWTDRRAGPISDKVHAQRVRADGRLGGIVVIRR